MSTNSDICEANPADTIQVFSIEDFQLSSWQVRQFQKIPALYSKSFSSTFSSYYTLIIHHLIHALETCLLQLSNLYLSTINLVLLLYFSFSSMKQSLICLKINQFTRYSCANPQWHLYSVNLWVNESLFVITTQALFWLYSVLMTNLFSVSNTVFYNAFTAANKHANVFVAIIGLFLSFSNFQFSHWFPALSRFSELLYSNFLWRFHTVTHLSPPPQLLSELKTWLYMIVSLCRGRGPRAASRSVSATKIAEAAAAAANARGCSAWGLT